VGEIRGKAGAGVKKRIWSALSWGERLFGWFKREKVKHTRRRAGFPGLGKKGDK